MVPRAGEFGPLQVGHLQRMNALLSNRHLVDEVVDAIRGVVGPGPVALHEPLFAGNEWSYLKECLDSTFVSSVGEFVGRFEDELAAFTGAKHAVAVVNGTAALHIALKLAGVEAGDEVLLPALTFVATANAVAYCQAIPHFVDASEANLGIDVARLRDYLAANTIIRDGATVNRQTDRVIRAIVPMHTFGHPGDIDGLMSLAHDYNLVLVEDAAESLGSLYRGRQTGTFGLIGALSFNGNKTITTGGGGALLTNDTHIAIRAKHLTTTAKLPHRWDFRHDEVGYNYRMPNLNAALGVAQLEKLPELLAAKRKLHQHYQTAFADVRGLSLVSEPADCASNYWLQAILLEPQAAQARDDILTGTNGVGLMTRPAWVLMHELPHFASCPRMPLPVATSLAQRLVNIPSSAQLAWETT